MEERVVSGKKGLLALSPLFVFTGLFLGISLLVNDFYKVPMTVVFVISSVYALIITKGLKTEERIRLFSKGAGEPNLMLMVWIFILAGAFASSAKEMGAIDAMVNLTLYMLPDNLLLAGLFLSACLISLSIGTSVGTIVALVPVASGIAAKTGIDTSLMLGAVVGGAFFGDNLSFISDTTVVATRTQGCELKDKFKVNFRIVLPAAVVIFLLYIVIGSEMTYSHSSLSMEWVKVIPYLVVLIFAVIGMNVMTVLILGNLLTGLIGLLAGTFTLSGWFGAMGGGITSMGELIIISMLAGGLLEVIRHNGGIDYIIARMTRYVNGKRGAELSIAFLVSLTNMCTANNTIAILSVGNLAKNIADKYGVDRRKSASILDTFSCCVQGLIPYGAQLLMASGLAHVNPVSIIPCLYYPMVMGVFALMSIWFRFPRQYS